ncbi:TnsA endonuclease N-terminal domain-containing protein [Kordiimonas lipolytica]|uniref:TnsA endonuclease N-terminal domain-containing protein n=1 Tax=Kordiimonas lipolytica TaxID=1662421 RepID=A0ABV8UE43_9PROT|nr:TnsA endonuclease N-terminal domain-containing protein [Kordiimonas lipolytica]
MVIGKYQDQLLVKYYDQKSRGLFINPQKCGRVSSFRPAVISQDDAELTSSIGETLVSLFNNMHKLLPARELHFNHRSITGWISGKPKDDQIQFESTLERDFAYLAFFDPRVLSIQAQPFTLEYTDAQGNPRIYTPDFQVRYLSSFEQCSEAIVEIKYQKELEEKEAEFADRFASMKRWSEENNTEFHIVTENEIRVGSRLFNIKSLYPFLMINDDDGEGSADLGRFIKQNAPITIKEVLNQNSQTREEQARVQHNIWRIIAIGQAWIKMDEPITYDTVLHSHPVADTNGLFFSSLSFEEGLYGD